MNTSFVRGACPHDCPDTCALRITVQDGRVIKVQGDPDHPPTHGALCTKVSRYAERTYHPERVLTPLKRVGPKGSGTFAPVAWDDALRDIAERLRNIAARGLDAAQAIVPYSYCGTMGLVQGESMAARFFNRLGASLNDLRIGRRRSGRGNLRGQDGHARRALCAQQIDPDLGQQLDRLEPALLDLCPGSEAQWREIDLHRPAQDGNRRQVPRTHRLDAGH
jgi:anaerobic selenocysteine-containing dehydrogenase